MRGTGCGAFIHVVRITLVLNPLILLNFQIYPFFLFIVPFHFSKIILLALNGLQNFELLM